MPDAIVRLESVSKSFDSGSQQRVVLSDVSFEIHENDRIAVIGPSGSGKSTLLNLIAGLDVPSAGRIHRGALGVETQELQLSEWRNQSLGFIFQDHHLLPQCNVIDNILMPICAYRSISKGDRGRAEDLLKKVGLGDRARSWPLELSGGERQRVAVLRSMILKPRLLLADEPTGALDTEHADEIAALIDELQEETSCALLLVTHHQRLADRMAKQFLMQAASLKAIS